MEEYKQLLHLEFHFIECIWLCIAYRKRFHQMNRTSTLYSSSMKVKKAARFLSITTTFLSAFGILVWINYISTGISFNSRWQ